MSEIRTIKTPVEKLTNLPALQCDLQAKGVTAVIELHSDRAVAQVYSFGGSYYTLVYGSDALFDRWMRMYLPALQADLNW